MKLLYGRGVVILSGTNKLVAIMINYRGNPFIIIDKNKHINKHKNGVVITGNIEGRLFRYFGYLKILTCYGIVASGEEIKIKVNPMGINLPELMDEKPEDISESPEKLRHTYTVIKKYKGKQR